MSTRKRLGTVITFYSYKGGTGRSMAVSNLAWVLASNGFDVLLIDWDLEAPGLHRYLRPFLVDPELRSTPGLVDFVWDVAKKKMTPISDGQADTAGDFPSLEDYVVGLDWKFEGDGSISFLPAGRQDENYAQRVNTFDWDNFYERLGGGKVLQAARDGLRPDYDYILIDSRTGVSDTSSICTVQLPDLLAICFTLNHQSIRGAAAVATSIQGQRESTFCIFPIPTRLENAETDKLKAALTFARQTFAPFLRHVQRDPSAVSVEDQQSYWSDVQTPYRTFYAFEEVPAAFKDQPGAHDTILASTERLARWLTRGTIRELRPSNESVCESIVASYAFGADKPPGLEDRLPERPSFMSVMHRWDNRVRLAIVRNIGLYATLRAIVIVALVLGLVLTLALKRSIDRARIEQAELSSLMASLNAAQGRLEEQSRLLTTLQSLIDGIKSPEPPDLLLAAARTHPENKTFRVFLHYRADSQASLAFVRTARERLAAAHFTVGEDTADSKVSDAPIANRNVGPQVEYLTGKTQAADERARAAAERIVLILNSDRPREFAPFRAMGRGPKPQDFAFQSQLIAAWF